MGTDTDQTPGRSRDESIGIPTPLSCRSHTVTSSPWQVHATTAPIQLTVRTLGNGSRGTFPEGRTGYAEDRIPRGPIGYHHTRQSAVRYKHGAIVQHDAHRLHAVFG